jgi:trans-2-enoyl-CoA reductase
MSESRGCPAARYHRTGAPSEVVQVDDCPVPPPGPEEVAVRMQFAPINPADLNMIEGKYGEARPLPDVPGNEGAGVVEAVGAGVDPAWTGRTVLVSSEAWRARGNWPVADIIPVPAALSSREAGLLRVNPPTAWLMLRGFVDLRPGEWIVQNAATSAVGRAVIEIARHRGWKTLNFVRRPDVAAELRAIGADAVVTDTPEAVDEARAALGGARPALGLNAVGGASATRIAGLLAPGGTLVTYGAMSKEALKVPNSFLIFRDIAFRGFWLTRWLKQASPGERAEMFASIFQLAQEGCFRPPVAGVFPLDRVSEALALATSGGAGGKVLLDLGSE